MFNPTLLKELLSDEAPQEYWDQMDRVDVYNQKIIKAFSPTFFDAYWSEVCQLLSISEGHTFHQGLNLGAQLLLALTAPIPLSKNLLG